MDDNEAAEEDPARKRQVKDQAWVSRQSSRV